MLVRRGLLMLVSKRRKLLNYLENHAKSRYTEVIGRLGCVSSCSPVL